jgi:hypothetical protein
MGFRRWRVISCEVLGCGWFPGAQAIFQTQPSGLWQKTPRDMASRAGFLSVYGYLLPVGGLVDGV